MIDCRRRKVRNRLDVEPAEEAIAPTELENAPEGETPNNETTDDVAVFEKAVEMTTKKNAKVGST